MDELTLFDAAAPSKPSDSGAPRCAMCARQSRWLSTRQQFAAYCAGASCSNRERICQVCDAAFTVGLAGAGNKFCADHSSTGVRRLQGARAGAVTCAWCEKPARGNAARRRPGARWDYVCNECTAPIWHLLERLRRHRVPLEMVRRLLTNPLCEICGVDIVAKRLDRTAGRAMGALVVDHDHNCCPGEASCGRCIRGFLCNTCNLAVGHVGNSADRAQALAFYLARFDER